MFENLKSQRKNMRKYQLLFLISLFSFKLIAQSVNITPSGVTPTFRDALPKLSYDALINLTSPQLGDMVVDTTFKCLRFYNGTKWTQLMTSEDSNVPSITAWSAGGVSTDGGQNIKCDTLGNVYVSGEFYQSATFGDTTITSPSNYALFIAKYSKLGKIIWVRQITDGVYSTNSKDIKGIGVSQNGDVFLTGSFEGTIYFGSSNITANGGFKDIFIAKYNANGVLSWVKKEGGASSDFSNAIVLDHLGSFYITGNFYGTTMIGTTSKTAVGDCDSYVAKYDINGNFQWLKTSNGSGGEISRGIAYDSQNGLYITGDYTGTATFGSYSATSLGSFDIFITYYSTFNNDWGFLTSAGGTGPDEVKSIIAGSGSYPKIAITGTYYRTAIFPGFSQTYTLNAQGSPNDAFIANIDSYGRVIWVNNIGDTGNSYGFSSVFDNKDNLFVIGSYSGIGDFGNQKIVSNGLTDCYIAKYDFEGKLVWAKSLGGKNSDVGTSITFDKKNNIFFTGFYSSNGMFGNVKLNSVFNSTDIFIGRVNE
jgi:hypothetical protein